MERRIESFVLGEVAVFVDERWSCSKSVTDDSIAFLPEWMRQELF